LLPPAAWFRRDHAELETATVPTMVVRNRLEYIDISAGRDIGGERIDE